MTIAQPFSFTITDDPEIINSLFRVDDRARKLLQETYDDINSTRKSKESKLIDYVQQYPDIPQFKNRLSAYYELSGNRKKAKEIKLLTLHQHPDYLFGKICVALDCYYENKFAEMPALLGEHLELNALYPERKIFHVSEVMSYYKVVAIYLNAVDRTTEAWAVIDKMEGACPGNPDIENATREIMRYNLKHASRRMAEDEKTSKMIKGSFLQNVKIADGPPQFENKIIEELYRYDFRLSPDTLKQILELPEDGLIQDLKKVLADSIARYRYFETAKNLPEERSNFLLHAIFILAEKGRADCLPDIFNTFRNGEDFTEFYFGDTKTELLWIAFYKLADEDISALFRFLKEPNIDTFSKTPVNQALEQLFYHRPSLRENIIEGYKELGAFFIANQHDETVMDTHVIADVVCTMRDMAPDEFKDQIKQLYENGLVYLGYAGDFASLMKHERDEKSKKKIVPSIFQLYEEVVTTWAGYREEEEFENDQYYEVQQPILRTGPKIGRNDPCPCGSGKKYKKCCMG